MTGSDRGLPGRVVDVREGLVIVIHTPSAYLTE